MITRTRIREIWPGDWNGIAELEETVYASMGLAEGLVALESRAAVSPSTCFVVDAGRRIAGYVLSLPYPMFRYPDLTRPEQSSFRSPNLHLHDLVVAEEFRRGGLGKSLLQQVTTAARSEMYERISLVAVGGSDTFWSAQGFHSYPRLGIPANYGDKALYMSRLV